MWSLLQPLFFWGALAALVPLLLHLLQRRRTVRLPFSTIRFLRLAQQRSAHRVRMQHLLLWLVRTLLALALPLAFALPVLRTTRWRRLIGQSRRDVGIVWDTSYSMDYRSGRLHVWEQSREAAQAIVQSLEEGDRVCLFLADEDVTPLLAQPTTDLDLARSLIETHATGPWPSDLLPAMRAAYAALEASGAREKELFVLTDGQALPWSSLLARVPEGERATDETGDDRGWDPDERGQRVATFALLAGAEAPANLFPLGVSAEPEPLLAGQPARLRAKLGRTGTPPEATVTLHLDDGSEARRHAPSLGEGVLLPIPPLPPGRHAARVESPPDGLSIDDPFFVLLRTLEQLRVLCAGTEDDAFFVARALRPDTRSGTLAVDFAAPETLAGRRLEPYTCVVLCNPPPLAGPELLQLEGYVKDGGTLVLFPGDRAGPAEYAGWTILPGRPAAVETLPAGEQRQVLRRTDETGPILSELRLPPGATPYLALQRCWRWGEPEPGTESVLSAGADRPVLMHRSSGEGQVIAFSVSADRAWSSLPLSPLFLPILHELVHHAGRTRESVTQQTSAATLALDGSWVHAGTRVTGPDGQPRSVRLVQEGAQSRFYLEDARRPGLYLADTPEGPRPVLAVNVDRRESNLQRIEADTLAKRTGLSGLRLARDVPELQRLIEEHRTGRPFAEALLWLALSLAVMEALMANRLSRHTAVLSEQLVIDEGGRVCGEGSSSVVRPSARLTESETALG